ncbi:hypothetical protein AB0K60_31025 [Thermopolyspora sp. NPDC052614]|uniref:hypothetical protein n=1 Tax=Thermopolyspora sp. NPDC052614 TaxID=3155682 RepID=UPI003418B9B7
MNRRPRARAFAGWCAGQGRVALPATGQTLAEYTHHLCAAGQAPATRFGGRAPPG